MVKGDSLGEVIDTSRFDFVAAIAQSEVSRLFTHPPRDLEARIKGHAGESLPLDSLRVIPMERNELPSLAISWQGGGELEVAQGPGGKIRTVEPFYEVRAHLAPTPGVPLLQGRSGKIRFVLGWSPLLPQLWRKLRQELQKYYRV
jgi:putative peptide zinc metalloprotease protein